MKRLFTVFVILVCFAPLSIAQQSIDFKISDGLNDNRLKYSIEASVSRLLTELNLACQQGRSLQLGGINMTQEAVHSLNLLWNNLHFTCEDSKILERCLTSVNGYQIRNIAIRVIPIYEGYDGRLERELTVSFSKKGEITGVRMAMESQVYSKILKSGDAVDLTRREEIVSFCEAFRSHYDEKDIEALNKVFSDDALIITGSVVMKRDYQGDQPKMRPEIVYRTQNKQEYLSRLKKNFDSKEYVKVTFSDYKVVRSGDNPNFYGVTLHQHWKAKSYKGNDYEDDGYVFLLWEFRENGEPPIVHVRTWQPDRIEGMPMPKEKIINIKDFEIPTKMKY